MRRPQTPPPLDVSALHAALDEPAFRGVLAHPPERGGEYVHWDDLRRKTPPEGMSHRLWWTAIKLGRMGAYRRLFLRDREGRPYVFSTPDPALRDLHAIDKGASGSIQVSEPIVEPALRDQFVLSSLIEEAIASSQLEGAATTSRVAREMLRSGRPARGRDERMILNNFRAIRRIRELKDEALTPGIVFELHRIMTEETLDQRDDAGRVRRVDETVRVIDLESGEPVYVPPHADELKARLEEMCAFANEADSGPFVHPVVRAILLHFALAVNHPFVDGNGRTARALFYWSMLRQGYWLAEFLSISLAIKKSPARYARAYLYAQCDDNDATYFLLYHLHVIRSAIDELHAYLARKMAEVRRAEALVRGAAELNHRQKALVAHALRHPGGTYSIRAHQNSQGVVYQTARTDLLDLAARGYLRQQRVGRTFEFRAGPKLERAAATAAARR